MKLSALVLPYLLLVTFYSPSFDKFDGSKVKSMNESPYDGVAVQLLDPYRIGCSAINEDRSFSVLNLTAKKHLWPWVFFNRFVGAERNTKKPLGQNREHWLSIKGMDLYDEAGALTDFYCIWKKALQVARRMGSPGIVVDPEPYNDYAMYELGSLAKKMGQPKEVVKKRLREIGHQLTDIADEVYPGATMWLLFTALGTPERKIWPFSEGEYRTVTYIVIGMLERAKERQSRLRFVSGGEVSLGYCFESFEDLSAKISWRRGTFEKFLLQFQNLQLGGTISPWKSAGTKTDWLLKGRCGKSSLRNIIDFEPLFLELFKAYDYIWIYAAGAAGFNPYNRTTAYDYHAALAEVLNRVDRSPKRPGRAGRSNSNQR